MLQPNASIKLTALSGSVVDFSVLLVESRDGRLRLLADRHIPLNTVSELEIQNNTALGEVIYCKPSDSGYEVWVQVEHWFRPPSRDRKKELSTRPDSNAHRAIAVISRLLAAVNETACTADAATRADVERRLRSARELLAQADSEAVALAAAESAISCLESCNQHISEALDQHVAEFQAAVHLMIGAIAELRQLSSQGANASATYLERLQWLNDSLLQLLPCS